MPQKKPDPSLALPCLHLAGENSNVCSPNDSRCFVCGRRRSGQTCCRGRTANAARWGTEAGRKAGGSSATARAPELNRSNNNVQLNWASPDQLGGRGCGPWAAWRAGTAHQRGGGGACLVTGLKLGPKLASFWASGLPSTVGAGATTDMIVSNFVLHWNFKLYLFIQLPFYTQNTRLEEATKSRPGLCTGLHSFAPSRPPTPPPGVRT